MVSSVFTTYRKNLLEMGKSKTSYGQNGGDDDDDDDDDYDNADDAIYDYW